jgi:hypothetical protein
MVVLLISYPQLHRNIKLPGQPDFTDQVPVEKLAPEKRSSKLIDYRAAPNSCPDWRSPMAMIFQRRSTRVFQASQR